MKSSEDQTPRHPRPKQELELSTVYWYKRQLPPAIDLVETDLGGAGLRWGFSSLYGHRGRQEGFMAARERGVETGEHYTVIDLRVRLENPILQGKRTAENIVDQDILPVHQLVSSFAGELDQRLREDMHLRRTPKDEQTANVLLGTLLDHPHATARLLSYPEFAHIKLLVHVAKPSFSATPLPIATIRNEHLNLITEARCRLDPELEVRLPSLAPRPRDRDDDRPAPAPVASPKSPRS